MLGADSHTSPNGPTAPRALRTVPRVESGVIDLRKLNGRWLLLGAPTLWVLTVVVVVAVVRGEVDGGPGARVVAGVLAGFFGLLALLMSLALFDLRRPRRLLIDHEGIGLDTGRRRPEFRLAWTEIAGVSLRLSDKRRRIRARRYHRWFDLPPEATPIVAALELYPADAEAVRRHPELRRAWRLGGERCWMFVITGGPGAPPPVGALVQRWHPELWRGEHSGSLLADPR
jgi:hypothetical protein